MKPRDWPLPVHIGVFAVVYFLTASFGLRLGAEGGFATAVWPPTGIALAVLSLWGSRLWPGVTLGAFLVNAALGAPLASAAGMAFGNTLEALLGTYLLRRVVGFRTAMDRLRDVLGLVLLAAVGSTLVSATIGVASLWLGGAIPTSACGRMWWTWWIGDMMGDLLVAPLLFAWSRPLPVALSPRRAGEAAALLLAVVSVSAIVFGDLVSNTVTRSAHFLFPLLIWAALRYAQHGAVTANFLVSAIAIGATALGLGPFARATVNDSLLALQSFMSVVAVTILILAANVSERRRLEEDLRQRAEELAEEDRRKGDYLSMLAHELRGPLGPIRNAAEVLKRLAPDEPRLQRAQQTIERQVSQQSRLVDDLLNVTRLRHGKIVLRRERMDLAQVVRDVAEDARGVAEQAGLTLTCETPDQAIWMEADEARLAQVVANLIENAVKFTEQDGHLSVRLTLLPDQRSVAVAVRDTGIGIEPRMLAHIFETFTQADRSLDRSRGGLGLGLALVKGLVELHGGDVRAHSAGLGRGSEFVVTLPLQQAEGDNTGEGRPASGFALESTPRGAPG